MEPRDTYATENPEYKQDKSWAKQHLGWLIVISLLLIGIIAVFIWKNIESNRYEDRIEAMELYYNDQIDSIVINENKAFLQKIMKPLVWAVRSEMIRENLEQVKDYMRQFVQAEEMQVELVMVVNDQGQIIASTNQKLEGQQYSGEFSSALLGVDDITVKNYEGNKLIAAAPIVSFSAKIGTLVVIYQPNEYNLEYKE